MSASYVLLSYKLSRKEHFEYVLKKQLLTMLDDLQLQGAESIKIWKRECSCEAGIHTTDDGDTVVCNWCDTGKLLTEAEPKRLGFIYPVNPDDEIPF